jgi:sn-glycerol 3-phosphate transport system substrate-binding protein
VQERRRAGRGRAGTGRRVAAVVAAIALAMAALGLDVGGASARRAAGGPCSVKLARGKHVEITFWHQMQGKNEQVLKELVAKFEAANPNITVRLVNQVDYVDLFTNYKAAMRRGDLPDLGQFEDTTVQQLVDTQSTVPMATCVEADKYSLSDFYARPIDFYTTQGVLRSMPWNVSNIVLMYNRDAVKAAGLDPDHMPTTFDGLQTASRQIVDRHVVPHGMALAVIPYVNEYLFARSGVRYVNNGNGRTARATQATFDTASGRKIWTWWADMVKSGLAVNTGDQPGGIDHLLAIGNGTAAMTIDSSGGLGRIYDVLNSGQFPNVDFGVAPLPGLTSRGGIPVGDGSLWLPKTGSPERQAAAWKFVKFLVEPAQLAALVVGTDGAAIPTRKSVAQDPSVQQLYAQKPFLKIPFDQLETGALNLTTSGSIIGDYQGVRDAVRDALDRMLTQGQAPAAALRQAEREATARIQDYNTRVGG